MSVYFCMPRPFCISICMSVCVCMYVCVCMSVYVCMCMYVAYVCLSLSLSISSLSLCPSAYHTKGHNCLFPSLYVSLSVLLSISLCLSVSLSLCASLTPSSFDEVPSSADRRPSEGPPFSLRYPRTTSSMPFRGWTNVDRCGGGR